MYSVETTINYTLSEAQLTERNGQTPTYGPTSSLILSLDDVRFVYSLTGQWCSSWEAQSNSFGLDATNDV